MNKRKSLGILAIAAAAMLLFTAVAAGPTMAAKGSGGHGKPVGGGTSGATLSVSPNPVAVGSACITISGSGFAANQNLTINAWFLPQPSVNTGTGSFSFVYCPSGGFWLAGPSSVQALDPNSLAVLATALYTVQ